MILLIKKNFTNQLLPFVIFCLLINGCAQQNIPEIKVEPRYFKIKIPFEIDEKGIVVKTIWGNDSITHKLYLDNHSPTWVNNNILQNNKSVSKSNSFSYRTNLSDGKLIEGDVYMCDSLLLKNVVFKNFLLYKISGKENKAANEIADGAFGENLMEKGIWKIDFQKRLITFASSSDSLDEMKEAYSFPAIFTNKVIEINVVFKNEIAKKFDLDLGFNKNLIMSFASFKEIENGNKNIFTDSLKFSTPSGSEPIKNTVALDTISINNEFFITGINTNDMINESLIGWRFFAQQFDFLILDYINKKLYVSKKKFFNRQMQL